MVNNSAEMAGRYGLSRARVAQVMNLLDLPGQIREYVSGLSPDMQRLYSGQRLQNIVALASEQAQVNALEELQNRIC